MRLLTRPLVSEIKEDWRRAYYHERTGNWTDLPHFEHFKDGRPPLRTFINSGQVFNNLELLDDSSSIEEINKATSPFILSLRICTECREYVENAVELQDDGEYGCDHICKNCVKEALKLFGE